MDKNYDVMIIGSGPAGLSAAINAKIRNKEVIVISNRLSSYKLDKAPFIENYLGFAKIEGSKLSELFLEHARTMGVEIVEKDIVALYNLTGQFSTMTSKQEIISAKTAILATGSVLKASIEGEDTFLGSGVSYCPTCDGMLYKGKKVAVLGYSSDSVEEANYLSEICEEVIFISPAKSKVIPREKLDEKVIFVETKVVSIDGDMKVQSVTTEDGKFYVEAVFILREIVPVDKLISGLELTEGNIEVNRSMATNILGLFACGDCTGKPFQISKATGEGLIAGLSAANYLDEMK